MSLWSFIALCVITTATAAATPPTAQLFQTAKDTTDRLTKKPPVPFYPSNVDAATATATNYIEVDVTQSFQVILGFGGAFTEAAAVNFMSLSGKAQQVILEAYWGKSGIGYSVGRVHMDSCDFSLKSYSFDNVSGDFNLQDFDDRVTHDTLTMIPFISQAMAASQYPIKLFLTPWSPPAWMKVPVDGVQNMTGSATPVGLLADAQDVWAQYFSRFITAYTKYSIPIWGLTVQNEPENAASWEACVYTPEAERDFVKNFLGPRIRADFPDLKIMGYDHNKDHVVTWANVLYNDPDTAQYIDGIAIHWYSGDQFYNVNETHNINPDKFILATEGCNCPPNGLDNWDYAEHYGHDIMGDLNSYVVGWTDWNLVLDMQGGPNHLNNYCDAPILVDNYTENVYIQANYYYIGQYSKFIVPSSVRVASSQNFSFASSSSTLKNVQLGDSTNVQDGASITMWPCDSSVRQQWQFVPSSVEGGLTFGELRLAGSNMCFDLDAGATNFNGATIAVWPCTSTPNQMWAFQPTANGTVLFNLKASNLSSSGACASIQDMITADGAEIASWSCTDMLNQIWSLNSETGELTSPLTPGKCATAGGPFVRNVAFVTPDNEIVVVVINESLDPVSFQLRQGDLAADTSIPPRSIQTYVYNNPDSPPTSTA